jgi:hypothetical protein
MQARSILDGNFPVRPWNELVTIQHIHRAPCGVDPWFCDTERLGAKDDGARTIFTGRILLGEPLEYLACQLSQSTPGSSRTWLPSFPLAMDHRHPVVDLIPGESVDAVRRVDLP